MRRPHLPRSWCRPTNECVRHMPHAAIGSHSAQSHSAQVTAQSSGVATQKTQGGGSVTSTPNFIKPVCRDVYTTRLRDANTAARFVTVFPGKMAFRPYRSPHTFPNAHTHLSHRPLCDLITLRLDHLTKATSSACGVRRRGVSSDVLADVT